MKWSAPEALRRRRYSEASDVFAFGVLLYEMAAQRSPWQGRNNLDVVVKVCSGERMKIPTDDDNKKEEDEGEEEDEEEDEDNNEDDEGGSRRRHGGRRSRRRRRRKRSSASPHVTQRVLSPLGELMGRCWAAEPQQRPRMVDVWLAVLGALG